MLFSKKFTAKVLPCRNNLRSRSQVLGKIKSQVLGIPKP
jgi:hypothetical protein